MKRTRRACLTSVALAACAALLVSPLAGCSGGETRAQIGQAAAAARVTFVELGSDRCVPCIQMRPVMDEIRSRYAGEVNVVFHDVWTEQGQPYVREFRIRVIPTQVFLDAGGREFFRHEGYLPAAEVEKILALQGVRQR